MDKNGKIQSVNKFLLHQFAYDREEELAGKGVEILIPARFHKGHVGYRGQYSQHPSTRPMGTGRDLYGIKKDGSEFPVEISLSSYTNKEGVFVIAFISDITQRKESERGIIDRENELKALNKKMERLNLELEDTVHKRTLELQAALKKLEVSKDELTMALSKEKELSDLKSRFVAMASHEFKTPLSTILSSASLLSRYVLTEEQPRREKHTQRIKSAVNNLTDILNDFLSIEKIEEGRIASKKQLFDIKEMVENLCSEITGLLKKSQHFSYKHTGNTEVNFDETLLKNILINLISNAIKFSDENSTIYINTHVTRKNITLIVKDNGIGMSVDDQKHLFERFFRGANAANIQGTGLGLHIVAKYAELMNGHIHVKSELNKGTEIKINFTL